MKSFLKWAGGKSKLLDCLKGHFPIGNRFIDLFMGSCVVSLNVDYPVILANDVNRDLHNLWLMLQEFGCDFIDSCESLFIPNNNIRESYNALRDEFNSIDDPYRRSMLFVYLNRHCFNGLCRYNSKNIFNVPFGKYTNPGFPRKEMEACRSKATSIQFVCKDFREVMNDVVAGDVVYCDPPYIPLSTTASFSSYTAKDFTLEDQIDVAKHAVEATLRGATVVISNSSSPLAIKIYTETHPASNVISLEAARMISANGNRGSVTETLAIYLPKR